MSVEHGVLFERYNDSVKKHSATDWGLIFSPKEIKLPAIKTTTVDIPGGNGSIDLTEAFGKTFYQNRVFPLVFSIQATSNEFETKISEIANFIHGQMIKITVYNDSEFYYLGRCSIDTITSNKNIRTISITCNCEPFKYKQKPTTVIHNINGTETLILKNLRKEVIPKITVSDNAKIKFNDTEFSLSAGSHKILDIELVEGDNQITILSGTGIITFEYQEGEL